MRVHVRCFDRFRTLAGAAGLVAAFALAGAPGVAGAAADRAALQTRAKALLGVLPAEVPNPDNPFSDAKIELGRMLYYEPRMSINEKLSCNTCHVLTNYG